MIVGGLLILLIIPCVILFTIGIPIIIGVCVYKDADKRIDCNPWLWALVAALVPSFIGLVVYMIIRRDYPLKYGYQQKGSEHNAAGTDEDKETNYYQENYDSQAVKHSSGLPTWGKALIIIGAVIIGICLLTAVGSVCFSIISGNNVISPGYSNMF